MTTVFVSLHHQCFFPHRAWNPCRNPCFLAGERRAVTKGLVQGQAGKHGTGHRDSPSTRCRSSPPASPEGRQLLVQLRSKQLSRGQLTVCNQNQALYCVSKRNLCTASQRSILSGLQTSEMPVMRSCRAHAHTNRLIFAPWLTFSVPDKRATGSHCTGMTQNIIITTRLRTKPSHV